MQDDIASLDPSFTAVQRLAREHDELRASYERRGLELSVLNAELARLRGQDAKVSELRAETEHLNQALNMVAQERDAWKARAQRERAEAEQLRAIARVHLDTGRMLAAELMDANPDDLAQARDHAANLELAIEKTWRPEVKALRAEVERLRWELKKSGADLFVVKSARDTAEHEVERLRAALVQIENWVGKLPSNMGEAALIFDYIDKACEQGLVKPKE
jgi:chromosome segregation ATPase